jgi:hypothetical protein
VTSGGIGVVRKHQLQKKAQPLPFIKGGTTKEKKKTKVLTQNKWPWVPAGLDAKTDRAGWLPAVSYCSALLCSALQSQIRAVTSE